MYYSMFNSKGNSSSKGDTVTRFSGLNTISDILILFSWIIGILSLIAGIVLLLEEDSELVAVYTLIGGVISAFVIGAFAQLVKVIMAIEVNTRKEEKVEDIVEESANK